MKILKAKHNLEVSQDEIIILKTILGKQSEKNDNDNGFTEEQSESRSKMYYILKDFLNEEK